VSADRELSSDSASDPYISDENAALLTDLYELTMVRAYHEQQMTDIAVFDLFMRRLPEQRNYLVAAGLDDALRYLERLHFTEASIAFLRSRPEFTDDFCDWLRNFRFTGDVYAVPEGTPVFADEPIMEVVAPIAEAQLAETFLLNQITMQTVLASKAARVVHAAQGRTAVDFGMRRMHGTDAALKAARAFHIAGIDATSNVLAGQIYGMSITGTMAHSYIESHDSEIEAFRCFMDVYPDTVLLVDTYDTIAGVQKVIELAEQLGDEFRVRAIRLDSGDLAALAKQSRRMLDDAGLNDVGIFASGGLDEHAIAELVAGEAPLDGFGVGTSMGVSKDAPALDSVYKLVAYEGQPRMKLSRNKATLPGRKQVFRCSEGTDEAHDVIALADETDKSIGGRPLLRKVMENGLRLAPGKESLEQARKHCAEETARLPQRLRSLDPADPPYPVRVSAKLASLRDDLEDKLADRMIESGP